MAIARNSDGAPAVTEEANDALYPIFGSLTGARCNFFNATSIEELNKLKNTTAQTDKN